MCAYHGTGLGVPDFCHSANHESKLPHLHQSLTLSPIEDGEYIIKDAKESKTWLRTPRNLKPGTHCTQVLDWKTFLIE